MNAPTLPTAAAELPIDEQFDIGRRALSNFEINGYPHFDDENAGTRVLERLIGLVDVISLTLDDGAALFKLGGATELAAHTPVPLQKTFEAIGDLAALAIFLTKER